MSPEVRHKYLRVALYLESKKNNDLPDLDFIRFCKIQDGQKI